ncbi:hypothetical protein IQ241_16450 [Romeria aff. gracilis LEGE 07310]|uniref:Uncharacterized protein n=1 Tax=Vasconcelosia minhoensis LEGE 07310 TaxID=915328 RepID=A0A8J7DDK0_9CYAN|nr:hypothetical protein [Romeria gracilis]MBE9078863.1 hypothetical protein [Romeria aff. gracilis LEGE 07310]
MSPSESRFHLPIIAIACVALFLGYVLFTTGYKSLTCERLIPGSVQCESTDSYLFGLVTRGRQSFDLKDVQVESELRDRTPRGGVRFSHTITLWGEGRSFSSDPFRSPLSRAAIREQLQSFIEGKGPLILNFQHSPQVFALIRSGLLAILLGIVAWSFWDIRWPPNPPPVSKLPDDDGLI